MKKIVFLTGTRADYGKIKSIIKKVYEYEQYKIVIYVTGMHLLRKYGLTYQEIIKDGFKNIYLSKKINRKYKMDEVLAKNVLQFSKFVKKEKPDMIFVHGDRVEAMAGAIVGALNNIYVSHIEGGEISGTIDESIRHSISKLSNFHFVSNEKSKKNLIQLGENKNNVFVVGSPDLDIMKNNNFNIQDVKNRYNIKFKKYAILIYHPVTTEIDLLKNQVKILVESLVSSNKNYIVIYPNNDMGSDIILKEYKKLSNNAKFSLFPSIRFEYFLSLLKNADFVIGNSSMGIRECGIYGIPSINIGSRQDGRYDLETQKNLCCVDYKNNDILNAIKNVSKYRKKNNSFGKGNSNEKILKILNNSKLWETKIQKKFISIF